MKDRKEVLCECIRKDYDEDIFVEDIDSGYDENLFETKVGEFLVLTDKEADEYHRRDLENLIDDIGITGTFGSDTWQWNYIKDNFLTDSGIGEYQENDYRSYYEDIESESDTLYENRQQREITEMLANNDIIPFELEDIVKYLEIKDNSLEECLAEEDLLEYIDTYSKIQEYFEKYEENKDDYIEKCTEIIISEYDSPADWVVFNFGKDALKDFIENGMFEVDLDGINEWVMESDGRGNSLASYDGVEHEVDDFYIYRIN